MVLATLLIVLILASVLLNIMLSQSRFTQHQTGRIQAYFASQAGLNYAIEKLRLGNDPLNWPFPAAGNYSRTLCRSGCDVIESALPFSVSLVNITVYAPNSPGCLNPPQNAYCISATANYTSPAL